MRRLLQSLSYEARLVALVLIVLITLSRVSLKRSYLFVIVP